MKASPGTLVQPTILRAVRIIGGGEKEKTQHCCLNRGQRFVFKACNSRETRTEIRKPRCSVTNISKCYIQWIHLRGMQKRNDYCLRSFIQAWKFCRRLLDVEVKQFSACRIFSLSSKYVSCLILAQATSKVQSYSKCKRCFCSRGRETLNGGQFILLKGMPFPQA